MMRRWIGHFEWEQRTWDFGITGLYIELDLRENRFKISFRTIPIHF